MGRIHSRLRGVRSEQVRVPRISLLRVRSTRLTARRSRALIDAAAGLAMAVATEHVPNRMGEAQTIVQELASAGTLVEFCTDERVTCAIRGCAQLAAHKALAMAAAANGDEAPAASIRMDSRDIIRSIPSISATRSVAWLPTPDWSPPRLQPVLVRSMHWLQMRRAEWRCGTTQPGVGDRGTAEPRKPPSRSGLQPAMRMHAACQSG